MNSIPVLSICIPTYNRKEKLLHTVRNILKSDDCRFVITVSDNCSTDGTCEELQKIFDKRLIVYSMDKNTAAYQNYNRVIQLAMSTYVLHLLDKESFHVEYLSDFINYLELFCPQFGLVNITSQHNEGEPSIYKRGVSSVLFGGGGGDTHPSGFYYKRSLYIAEYDRIKGLFKDGNLWVLDFVSAGLGAKYDSVVYNHPLICYDNQSVLGGRTKSPYTPQTIYWYGGMRITTFRIFLRIILGQKCDAKEDILYAMLKKHIRIITFNQKIFFADKFRCNHYGLKPKYVSTVEILYWAYALIKTFNEECKGRIRIKVFKQISILLYGINCNTFACYILFKQKLKNILSYGRSKIQE